MFGDFYRGNRTPYDRLRTAERRVEDLEYLLREAKEQLRAATAEVVAFDGRHNQGYRQQDTGGLCGLF